MKIDIHAAPVAPVRPVLVVTFEQLPYAQDTYFGLVHISAEVVLLRIVARVAPHAPLAVYQRSVQRDPGAVPAMENNFRSAVS